MCSLASPLNTNIANAEKIIRQSFVTQTSADVRVIYLSFDQRILPEIKCFYGTKTRDDE